MRYLKLCALVLLAGASAPAGADTRLTMLTHYTDAQRAALTSCLAAYERSHPGLHIVQQQAEIDDDLQTILTGRLSGTSPDITNVYSVWAALLVHAGILDTPPPAIASFVQNTYVASTVRAISVDGTTWGIPAETSAFLLIYNRRLFRAAGITAPPRDWPEVIRDAAQITRRNPQGRITTAGFAFGPTVGGSVYPFLALLLSRGIPLFTASHDATNLASPGAIEVLNDTARLFQQGSTDATIQVRDFPSGAVGMMIFANWYKDALRQAFGDTMDDTVGVAAIPAGDGWKTVQYAFFWAVAADSPHKAEAWTLLRWLNTASGADPSCTGRMLRQLGALTGNRDDLQAAPPDAFGQPFAQAIAAGRAEALPNGVAGPEVLDRVRLMLEQVWTGHQAPLAAAQAADNAIKALLADTN